jgi:hypothetical protein
MNTDNIIPGYQGIMDLDVTNMEPIHIKQAINQHYNDIKIYAAEQSKLKPEHRYENTILRINKQLEFTRIKQNLYLDNINKAALERNIIYNNSKQK